MSSGATIKLKLITPQVIATCICLSLSAYVTLALHFLPKLYIMLFQPHKNDRSFFTTASKNVSFDYLCFFTAISLLDS